MTTPHLKSFSLITLVLAWFALSPAARAVVPAPDGGYPNGNTAEGDNALLSLTSGAYNTAIGFDALVFNTTGTYNTATGSLALFSNKTGNFDTADGFEALAFNTTGYQNTATGFQALLSNTTGYNNTATGFQALYSNTGSPGNWNTATGSQALLNNTTGSDNTANGFQALQNNTATSNNTATGFQALQNNVNQNNTADGSQALQKNTTGGNNTATGFAALQNNTAGNQNTAIGQGALVSNTGSSNIALGSGAGGFHITGDGNIYIGNSGQYTSESSTMRIGELQTKTVISGIYGVTTGVTNAIAVVIDSGGQLGTTSSSRRFKKEVKAMDQTSEAILALKPVTFQYKSDASGTSQFGLIAEEVAEVNPDLVVRDAKGEIYTVRYDAVNAMLLNEFLKEHHQVQDLKAIVAQQQKGMEALTASLKEQASQIQKVTRLRRVEVSKPAPQTVLNDQ